MNRLLGVTGAAISVSVGLAIAAGPAGAATYSSCDEAKAAGASNIRLGEPGYSSKLDGDNDGVACESGDGASSGSSGSSSSSSAGGGDSSSSGNSGSVTVNAGSGGQADRVSSAVPAAVGGIGVVVLVGSAVAVRRQNATVRT